MNLIEISSYPRSGNTWMLHLVLKFLQQLGCKGVRLPKGKHGAEVTVLNDILTNNGINVPRTKEMAYFYKSHLVDNNLVSPNKIIYIYRHPLDVMLSTINFLNWKNTNQPGIVPQARWDRTFINGKPKGCDQILADGEMSFYVKRFTERLGSEYYYSLLKRKSNYFMHVESACANSKVIPIKYEDLLEKTSSVVTKTLSILFGEDYNDIQIDLIFINIRTNYLHKKSTLLRNSIGETRGEYLGAAEIAVFREKHGKALDSIGY